MNDRLLDVHAELGSASVGRFHYALALILGSLIVFDGYDTVNPSYVVHYLAPVLALSPSQGGMLVSSGLIGFLVGAATHGSIADRYGRRTVLLGALWVAAICTVLTPAAGRSLLSFCLIRILTGVGLGVLLPLATTYMNEFSPHRYANLLPVWGVAFGWALGATLASFAGIYLTPEYGWQSLYYLGGLAFPLLIAMHLWLPESAKFLALRGLAAQTKALLLRIRPERAASYAEATLALPLSAGRRGSFGLLLAPGRRRLTLTIWLTAFLSLFGVYALSGWIPSVMIQRGESFAAGFSFGAVMQIASFVGALLGAWLIDRSGSATGWMAALWLCGGVAIAILAFFNSHSRRAIPAQQLHSALLRHGDSRVGGRDGTRGGPSRRDTRSLRGGLTAADLWIAIGDVRGCRSGGPGGGGCDRDTGKDGSEPEKRPGGSNE
jgi:MFS family permease